MLEELAGTRREICGCQIKEICARTHREQLIEDFPEMLPPQQDCLYKDRDVKQCDFCDDCGTDACAGPDLCGKMVLYVGGRSNLAHRYRNSLKSVVVAFFITMVVGKILANSYRACSLEQMSYCARWIV